MAPSASKANAAAISTGNKKRKRENVLWELDMVESKLAERGGGSTTTTSQASRQRLVRSRLALDAQKRRLDKQQGELKESPVDSLEKLQHRATELRRRLVEQKLFHATRELARSLKRAKPIETQKLIRKLKDARKNESSAANIARHELELTLLKHLDAVAVATAFLWKRVRKHPEISASELLPDAPPQIRDDRENDVMETRAEHENAQQNVVARLLKQKLVQSVVNDGIAAVLTAIKVANNEKKKKNDKSGLTADVESNTDEENEEQDIDEPEEDEEEEGRGEEEEGEEEEEEEEEAQDKDNNAEVDEASDSDLARYDSLIANESDDTDTDSIIGALDDTINYNEISDLEPDSLDDDQSDDAPDDESPPPKRVASAPFDGKRGKTIILPSLSSGYISPGSSDSEADFSDAVSNKKKSAIAKPRKNRRGQRARQKIWEEKYGRNAAHVKKSEQERRAKEQVKQQKKLERQQLRTMLKQDGNANGVPLGTKAAQGGAGERTQTANADKTLHPSWIAKQNTNKKVEFMGKKVVFD
ncbi:Bud-site selection protein [Limtongia smithiae]|uniref:Bud-site selection protein n=1 Tax=Limtongia smithiae TaxID=1125753 RepID=UPI0034CD19F4